jgi:hypothetical protein
MLATVEQTLERLYPARRWGEPADDVRFGAGISEQDGQALADELARELKAATFFRAGRPEEYCDYIYILCLGREPCLIQMRDGEVPVPDEIRDGDLVREVYLRVCLSSMARLAGVQEVAMELVRERDEVTIRELPRAGVYDAPLLPRMQRLVALLPAYDILHLDFGEISSPPDDFDPGDYAELYGGVPDRANYLFYPQPTAMVIIEVLPAAPPALD